MPQTSSSIHFPSLLARDFGAVGDGVSDDTLFIQNAINAAAVSGNATLIFETGRTYIVRFAGTKSVVHSVNPISQRYCLLLKSGVFLDLNGATLQLSGGQNASILLNEHCLYTDPQDHDMGVMNGVLNGNRGAQTDTGGVGTLTCLFVVNATRLLLRDLRFDAVREEAMRLSAVDHCYADNLHCTGSDGDGFQIGLWSPTAAYDLRVCRSSFGTLIGENCLIGQFGTRQGNPVVITARDCTFDSIRALNCGGGFKIQDGSCDVMVGQALFEGPSGSTLTSSNASMNSGLKIQGGSFVSGCPCRISVGEVISIRAYGQGLYLQDCSDVTIGNYIGTECGSGGMQPDVWIGKGSRMLINSIISLRAGAGGVQIRADSGEYQIGQISVRNCGQRVASTGVQLVGGEGRIGAVYVKDDQLPSTMSNGFGVTAANARAHVGYIEASGGITANLSVSSPNVAIQTVLTDATMALFGEVTLTAATGTTVANGNVWARNQGASGFFYPVLEIIPKNREASLLTNLYRTVPSTLPSTGFTIKHPLAVGTEKVSWRILGWTLEPSLPQ
jgi:hypothetical protein